MLHVTPVGDTLPHDACTFTLDRMSPASRARGVVLAVIAVGIVGAVSASVAGIVLADIFRPHAPGVERYLLPRMVQRSDRWSDWHRLGSGAFRAAAAFALPILLWLLHRAKQVVNHKAIVIAASVTALVMAVLTLVTRPLVEWDQLALRSVTVGTNISGYWVAGFGHGVRFILINDTEMSQGEYVPALLAHLGAPIIGTVALVVVAVALIRRAQPDPSSPPVVRP